MFHQKGPTFFELARQALSSTQKGYDLLAPKFDYTPFRTPPFVLDVVSKELETLGPFNDGIDLCCGTGAATELLTHHCSNKIVGVDMSEGMLNQARTQVARIETEQSEIEWKLGDVLDLAYEDEFDLAVSFGAFGHILPKDELIFIRQIHKALRVGGKFVFVTTYMPSFFSFAYLISRGFNFAMRVRNFVIRPPFIMYYLTFLLPNVQKQFEEQGFRITESSPFPDRFRRVKMVVAEKL